MDVSSRKLRNRILCGTSFAFFTVNLESLAATKTSSFERKQKAWSQLNYYSPTEGFHSKGSYGLHLGLGALAPTVAPSTAASTNEGQPSPELAELEQPQPRIFIGKGTPWPVDFGASLSILEGTKARQGGVHIQWTVFEGFQLPSIALRASRSMLSNFHEVKELTTDGVELGMSYGVFSYISLSISVSEQWEKGLTQAKGELLTLTDVELPVWSARRTIYSWGMNISPFTPFVQIGLEQSYSEKKAQAALAKVSFLL